MRNIKSSFVLYCVLAVGSFIFAEEGIWLPIQASCRSGTSIVASDTFRAVVSARTGVSAGLDRWDVLDPPAGPSGIWLKAVTRDSGNDLAIDFRPGIGPSADMIFPIEVFLQTSNGQGFTGTIQL